jgi:hypothetical protein
MKLLIAACPHSGTLFMAEVLRSAGVRCGHENVYNLWGRAPTIDDAEAEVAWEAIFDLGAVSSGVVVAHQTRDPIAWLNSWARMSEHAGDAAWEFLESKYPGIRVRQASDPIRTAMWMWADMNRRCDANATYRYRVEDLRGDRGIAILDELCRSAGIDFDVILAAEALASVGTTTNHHAGLPTYVPRTWRCLPSCPELDDFTELAQVYGYACS